MSLGNSFSRINRGINAVKLILFLMILIPVIAFSSACTGKSSADLPGGTTTTSNSQTITTSQPGSPTTTAVTGTTTQPVTSSPVNSTIAGVPPVTNLNPVNVGNISQIKVTNSDYVVFAWNDLGMHCINPTYDAAVILPPYNNLWTQVIKRGNPPQIVTQGVTVDYSIVNNTQSYSKSTFGQFWDNCKALFGITLEKNKGLNLADRNIHNGLSGTMVVKTDHFEADGIPLTPVDDSNIWNPYQVAQVTVKDASGKVVAQTRTMAPVSDELNCAKCHGSDTFNDILAKHDKNSGTKLVSQKPVLCASCHGDPALGKTEAGPYHYLSDHIHGFHAGIANPPSCYDCHPGKTTQCSRSLAHTNAEGNCTTCHGNLSEVSMSIEQGRVPWASEPKCVTCHSGVAQVDTGNTLYRNATGHGGVYCTSCHSSPHAMVPSSQVADNYQALQYQGKAVPISDCAACHRNSKGENNLGEYLETHGGTNPERANGCYVCHTSINTTNAAQWPHSFQWKNR